MSIVKKSQNCEEKNSKILKIKKKTKFSKFLNFVKIVNIVKNCKICKKKIKICQHCQNVGQAIFPHHSDQLSQRSQVSRVAVCMSSSKVLGE